jgi:proteasome alpha subunit
MSMPFYVPPEQMMQEKGDFARKGIARGRALVALQYDNGIVLVAENPSNNLRKIGEIYDRIAFAGVGKYNEFDDLRQAGVRAADYTGLQYSRRDVEGRALANKYAQLIGQSFTHESKPLEVEILIAEVGHEKESDRLFHITYDGTVIDEQQCCILGGDAEAVRQRLKENLQPDAPLSHAIATAASALSGPDRTLNSEELEVALLERGDNRRCFKRLSHDQVGELLK